jgi:hypothetical protein
MYSITKKQLLWLPYSYAIRKTAPLVGQKKKDISGNIAKIPSPNYISCKGNGFIVLYHLLGIRIKLVMDNRYSRANQLEGNLAFVHLLVSALFQLSLVA